MVRTSPYYRNLNNFLKTNSGLNVSVFSSVQGFVKPLSRFTAIEDIKLPFQISGRLVSSGSYKDKNYGRVHLVPEALKSTLSDWEGIFIYTSHAVFEKVMRGEDVSVNEVVGKITKTEWNDKDQAVDFYADVFDKQVAYKMANGLIKFISVGFAREVVDKNGEFYFMNLEPKEASLVFDPRDKKAEFKPV